VLTPQHNHDMNLLGDTALQPSLKPERHFHADIK
jgi:hypothetical protein